MKRDNQNGDDDNQNEGNNGAGGGGGGGGRPNKRFRGNDETIRLLIPSRVSNSFSYLCPSTRHFWNSDSPSAILRLIYFCVHNLHFSFFVSFLKKCHCY